jgi:DNA polymerase I-like protein with 3'-5' exonuclease and polymerase domains
MHVSTSPKFWDEKNERFFEKYYGINECHYKWKDIVLAGNPIEGPLGRSWSINLGQDKYGNLKIPWTTLTNYPVQGTGADIMMLVRIMAYKRIKSDPILNTVVTFVSTVHDSIVVDVPGRYVQQVVDLFHSCFADLHIVIWNNFKYDWNVPMDCECKMGMNMLDMKKVKPSAV